MMCLSASYLTTSAVVPEISPVIVIPLNGVAVGVVINIGK